MRAPLHECRSLMRARSHGIAADSRDDGRVGQRRRGGYDAVGDVVVDTLWSRNGVSKGEDLDHLVTLNSLTHSLTECSSSLTSSTVPSLNSHFTTSVSSETPFAVLALASLVQKLGKSGSLMRCQTLASGAGMRADSVTEVEVGIEDEEAIFGV